MMNRFLIVICLTVLCVFASAQTTSTNRTIATQQIRDLKNGALVVRLKTNDKSIEAYTRSGRNELADKLMEENRIQNQKLMDAFIGFYDFSKVYFIYAKSTNALLKNETGIFLNDKMEVDTSIKLTEKYFFLAEYGSITANLLTDEYHYKSVNHTEPSGTSASTNVIFISDTSLAQLREPFPFYQQTYLGNYNKAVDNLNRNLHKAFLRLDNSVQEERRKLKQQLKQLK